MTTNLTERTARRALDVVRAAFANELATGYPDPVLQAPGAQCEGWAIVWEEGPSDWPFTVTAGGPSEETRALFAEVGITDLPDTPPLTFPAHVFAEPVSHIMLGLYRED